MTKIEKIISKKVKNITSEVCRKTKIVKIMTKKVFPDDEKGENNNQKK